MAARGVLLLRAIVFLTAFQLSRQDTMLFVATPGGGDSGAGLYGAVIGDDEDDVSKMAASRKYDFKFGYHCTPAGGAAKRELDLLSVSYDDATGHVLLQRQDAAMRDLVTLYEGHVCQNGGGCGRKTARTLFDRVHFRYKKPRSFAYHDRQVYFLSQEVRRTDDGEQTLNIIELRRLAGCGVKYPVTPSSGFEVRYCSRKLATLVRERARRVSHEPMAGLLIRPLDGALYALAVVQELVVDDEHDDVSAGHIRDVFVKLYAVRIDDGLVRILHEERIGQVDYRRYIMKQIGLVDYLDDKVCWSAMDRILCADFFPPRERVTRVRYIVPPGAASGVVCRGEKIYSNITTGVAIADVTNDEVSLFFGCLADAAGIGGAGFARMRHWEFEAKPKLQPIRNVTSELYAGQMFLTDRCKYVKQMGTKSPSYRDYDLQSDQGDIYVHASHSSAAIGRAAGGLYTATIFGLRLLLSSLLPTE